MQADVLVIIKNWYCGNTGNERRMMNIHITFRNQDKDSQSK